jgi:ABC-type Fe3+/spermidine/putrescine transport system ATPase subunit
VADFMGECNFLSGSVHAPLTEDCCVVTTPLGRLEGRITQGPITPGQSVNCGMRPESLTISTDESDHNRFAARVQRTAFLGETLLVELDANGHNLSALSLQGARSAWQPGKDVMLRIPPDQVMVLKE